MSNLPLTFPSHFLCTESDYLLNKAQLSLFFCYGVWEGGIVITWVVLNNNGKWKVCCAPPSQFFMYCVCLLSSPCSQLTCQLTILKDYYSAKILTFLSKYFQRLKMTAQLSIIYLQPLFLALFPSIASVRLIYFNQTHFLFSCLCFCSCYSCNSFCLNLSPLKLHFYLPKSCSSLKTSSATWNVI